MSKDKDISKIEDSEEAPILDYLDLLTDMGKDGDYTVKKVLKDLSKASPPKQIAVGTGSGLVAGYLTMKAGKSVASIIGGSIIILQLAHHHGYITVDWNRMTSDTTSFADRMRERLRIRSRSGLERILDFAKKNIFVTGSFTAGFFLGIAYS